MAELRRKTKLGELLLTQGLVTQDQLRIALLEQSRTKTPLDKLLVQLSFIQDAALRDAVAASHGAESIDLNSISPDPTALKWIPEATARRHRAIPVAFDENMATLSIAMTDVSDLLALDRLSAQVGSEIQIKPLLASEAQLEACLDRFYGYELSVDSILEEIETGERDYGHLAASSQDYAQPMIRLVDALLKDAINRRASDIHLEPEHTFLRIRYRIDGVLHTVRSLHSTHRQAITGRIKILAGMDIAESRLPQDGHFTQQISGRNIDFRVASHPTIHGENLVLRVLDRDKAIIPLDQLGASPTLVQQVRRVMTRPEGLIIATGPTGSGKTTTLYSMLSSLNDESVNIMTLEDPVEYPLGLLRQTSMPEAHQLDFAAGIRSILRQDPDIILIGEMRDQETADMAFRAAMTGHRVLSTLHANSAVGAVVRLLDLGISAEIIAQNITGIMAQRLVRTLCPHCKVADTQDDQIYTQMNLEPGTVYRAVGCGHCHASGYLGRRPIMELLTVDAELESLIVQGANKQELLQNAMTRGYTPLARDGLRLVADGQTSLQELARVVDIFQLA
ncbi:type IV pilus assembly protein PilB [Novimethylophilus kurashikiensis]|uniref:Type IV pilus assembly protein PilB n=1 Tax=Novimethylophilus kurashikiensis TaxID=1825523 RepID=A0A2R5F6F7_9PROT|nr:GspE/PulE family protein [Novimethylophilus kurashikiensis]GBG13685.1 type IV pilus assembly protein PilB [Novimethylophilus kurashikiensis]